MFTAFVAVSVAELAVALTCLAIAGVARRYRDRPGGTPLVVLALVAAGWATAAGIASLVLDPATTRVAQYVGYVCSGLTAVAWFRLVAEYADRDRWLRPATNWVLAGLVLAEVGSLATNPLHGSYVTATSVVTPAGLFDPTPGPLLWIHTAWKAGLVVLGLAALLQQYWTREGLIRLQSLALLVAGTLPLAASLIEVLDLIVVRGLDIGVLGVALGALVLLWALFEAALLDVVPVARETLLTSMQDAVVALDADGRVVELNRQARAVFDVESGVLGLPAQVVFENYPALTDGAPWTAAATERAAGDGGAHEPVEIATTVDGEERCYELQVAPLRRQGPAATDDRIGSLLLFRDVTRSRQREREIEDRNARLDAFASVVSHDLRNPLNVARGRVDLARERADGATRAELDHAISALDRMNDIIEDVLLLAREGESVVSATPVSLRVAAEDARANVAADLDLAVTTDRIVLADRSRLVTVLENLFRNSVEHGSTGSRTESGDSVEHGSTSSRTASDDAVEHGDATAVTVGALEAGSGFFVADDGTGIPPADRERVFEGGYSTGDGTGLGLAIVSELAGAHGWSVAVTESDAGGARVEFTGVEGADDGA